MRSIFGPDQALQSYGIQSLTGPAAPAPVISGQLAHQKGSWQQLALGLVNENYQHHANALIVTLLPNNNDGAIHEYMVDVGLGGSGTKGYQYEVIAANLLVCNSAPAIASVYEIPLPRDVDVDALFMRCQCDGAWSSFQQSVKASVMAVCRGEPDQYGRMTTYGANVATTRGVRVVAGGLSNTLGAWAEITPATQYAMRELLVAFESPDGKVDADSLWDFAVGAAGQEVPFLTQLLVVASDTAPAPSPTRVPISIPAGSRLTARQQNTNPSTGWGVIAYGVD